MKKTLLIVFTLILSILLASCGGSSTPAPTAAPAPAQADTNNAGGLQVFTEEFPPITFSKDGKASGLASEVAEEIMKRSGVNATIQVVPWARGYKALEQGPTTALFTTMRTEEREKLFKWVGPLVEQNTNFYVLKDSTITIASLDDAKKVDSIGVITDYYSQQFLAGEGFKNLDASADANALVRKLLAGRISLMVSDSITLGEVLKANGAKPEDVKAVYTFITSRSYIAFSLDTPDDIVKQWQKALDEMKADGTFAKIYEKWLPGEVPPQ